MENENNNLDRGFVAKKSLGQNFLHAPNVISAMVHSAGITKGDIVLEVGPGKGALTTKLLEVGAQVIAVEKDDRAIPFLHDKFLKSVENGLLKIIHGDILELDPTEIGLSDHNYTIVANLPYYISGEFMRKFLETHVQPRIMVIMLQKELAKRIVDTKGSILSIAVKAYGNPKYITSVSRKLFRPIPNVDSAVVSIDNISKNFFADSRIDEKTFFEVLKRGFSHKRKVLIKNLEEKLPVNDLKNLWEREKWSLTIRAEELTLDNWYKLASFINSFPQK
jgi:16S rRNA (adenine1518-N6/adenine1519-N6)-dimethyltransferase